MKELLIEFVSETLDQLNSLEEQFVMLEKDPGDLEINDILPDALRRGVCHFLS